LRAVYRLISTGRGVGKTLLGERLVSYLRGKGVYVGVIKHVHSSIDLPGKDSERYLSAGAAQVVLASPHGSAVFNNIPLDSLDMALALLDPRIFLVIVEGFKRARMGKVILVAKNVSDLKFFKDVYAVVSDSKEVLREAKKNFRTFSFDEAEKLAEEIYNDALEQVLNLLPRTDCDMCGLGSCRAFAVKFLRSEKSILECPLKLDVRLEVDGNLVRLNPYVKKVFSEVLYSLVKTLKGVPEKPRKIVVKVEF